MRPVLLCLSILCSLVSFSQVWVRVPTPDPGATRNITRGISGTSSSDIWTVGYYERIPGSAVFENLILHWNGSNWQQFTTVNRSATLNDLYDVEAVSATEVWAAGTYSNSGAATPQLLKWNGSSWSHITPPGVVSTAFITSLDAISANDVWAVGGTYTNAYAIHYNGSTWTAVTVPLVGLLADELNAVHGLASNDVWAVGNSRDAAGRFRFMARHWNGSTWTNSPMPASVSGELGELLDVRMVSSNDVWAIGVILTGGFVKLHWDGSAWTVISPANGGGGALAPISSNNIYSVGADISHWNGSTWTLVDPLSYLPYPALRNAYVAPNGDVWATGRISEGTNQFDNLVMR
ncbi:MAG TPA: hypothetical protein VD996_00535, partial [Chitinophagaceae bacterium]|nr:hypothetical protein [Chitinophagaceae bacterium]